MTEMLQYIQKSSQTFWGTDILHVWFYVSVLLIVLFERSSSAKRVIGIYPVCFILLLYTPAAYWLIQKYTTGLWQYFARLYSMIPLPLTLGLGAVLLIDRVCSGITAKIPDHGSLRSAAAPNDRKAPIAKLILTGCFCGAMALFGTNIYHQVWISRAQNPAKVPDEVIRICNELHQDEGLTIAVPDALSSYIRQTDASFYTPYGRYVDDLGYELSKENPDPEYVMKEAGKEGCDYIVVYNNEENISQFQIKGWTPCSVQGGYLVYRIENTDRVRKEYNKDHQLIRESILDREGRPSPGAYGYYGISYEYDGDGNRTKETYLNADGEEMLLSSGYSSAECRYSPLSGRITSRRYLNDQGKPVCINGRYRTEYQYDSNGFIIQEAHYDKDDQLMRGGRNGYAIHKILRDYRGRVKGESFLDAEGRPVRLPFGYASYEIHWGDDYRIIRERFYDENGLLVGETGRDNSKETELFRFPHFTEGISEDSSKRTVYTTAVPNNHFNRVVFQLYDADSTVYATGFGKGDGPGEVSGIYHHDLPDGMYYLRLKANTNLADEWTECLVFLKQGDNLAYRYTIDSFEADRVVVKDASVHIE